MTHIHSFGGNYTVDDGTGRTGECHTLRQADYMQAVDDARQPWISQVEIRTGHEAFSETIFVKNPQVVPGWRNRLPTIVGRVSVGNPLDGTRGGHEQIVRAESIPRNWWEKIRFKRPLVGVHLEWPMEFLPEHDNL